MKLESGLIVPVPEADHYVDALRQQYDPASKLSIPAHITLLYPWLPPDSAHASIGDLRRALHTFKTFSFELSSVGTFDKTVFLNVTPSEPFNEMTKAIVRHWPSLPPYGGAFSEIIPHLTLADSVGPEIVAKVSRAPLALPIRAAAKEVWLMTNDESGCWSIAERVCLI